MTDKLEWIFYENPTRPKPGNGKSGNGKSGDVKSGDVKSQPANSKQQAPNAEPAQKQAVKLAKD